ncbi:MAG: thiol-disulfide isomerase/thioredoxin [Patiriisocius sp.]|jgi:thiol-disulfide isomerase/thioredoxin
MIKKLLLILCFPILVFSQHTLKGSFDTENGYQFGILYRIAPDNVYYVADSNVASDGGFELNLKEDLTPGMYRLVYNLPQDQYFFDFIYNGKDNLTFNFSKDRSVTFSDSQENEIWTKYRGRTLQFEEELIAITNEYEPSTEKISKALNLHQAWHDTIVKQGEGLLVAGFIEATKPFFPEEIKTIKQYKNQSKKEYLATIDFTNTTLQNSGIPLEQAVKYIFNYADRDHKLASQKMNVDAVAASIRTAEIVYQKHLLYSIYNFMVANQQIEIANYLAEKHLISIAETLQDNLLLVQLNTFKNISLGAKAPNFTWPEYDGDTKNIKSLYELKETKKYVLVFWSSLCSHCLKEIPVLHKKVATMKEGEVTVIAVGLEDFEAEWSPKASQFTSFINVCGLGKWNNDIGNKYDITATPTYFVLDKDKKITAKPETLEELLSILKSSPEKMSTEEK